MNEMGKTILFVAVAAVSLLAAFVIGPDKDTFDVQELVGLRLNQFEVDAPKRLKIIKFDKETATTGDFEVAEQEGLWSIPSKQGYPADATSRMAEAATCLIDREVLRVAAKSAGEHEKLGVVDPSASKLNSKSQGVGTRVVLTDGNKETLANMIIGNEVVDAEGQYYVRNADQDVVYVIALNPDKLSTRFEDWIEGDLLQLSATDVRRLHIEDYSAELSPILTQSGLQMQVNWQRRGEMTLRYDNDESKWIAERLQNYNNEEQSLTDYELGEGEELHEDVLNKLRDGLDDLKIVDVEHKPKGLSADLKAGEDFLKDSETASDLAERGFAPVALSPESGTEILSTEGELTCTMADGVEYVLRFGNLQLEGGKTGDGKPESPEDQSQGADDGIHRFLFVMARFNEEMIERPELDELPSLPEGAEDAKEEDSKDTEKSEEAEQEAAEDGEPSASEENKPEEEAADENNEPSAEEVAEQSEEKPTEDAEQEPSSTEDSSEENEEEKEKSSELEELIAQRKSIEQENQRRLDEYQEKVSAGQERVKELNERFGDWYYVIANDVFKQIHLGRDQVIREKEKPEGEEGTTENAPPESNPLSGLPNLPLNNSPENE